MRWHLIDKFEVLKKGGFSRAVKTFTGEEDFFKEHFEGMPMVPETLFIEMVAQAGGVLLGLDQDFQKEVILAKIDHARFGPAVVPPCTLAIEALIEEQREEGAWITGRVLCRGTLAAQIKILLITLDALEGGKNIVFNDNFLKHFRVYEIAKMSEALL